MKSHYIKLLVLSFLLFVLSSSLFAQNGKHHQLIQLSGIVVEKDSLLTIPYVAVLIRNSSGRGAVADNNGYYSFIVVPGDTIDYSAIGFRSNSYIIPDTLTGDKYAHIHLMRRDTFNIPTTIVTTWPSYIKFKAEFLKLDLPNNDMERAKKNMAMAAEKARLEGNPMDARANFMNTAQQEYDRLYWAGQLPPNNLLNPLAWANFIQSWKNGSLNIQ